MADERLRTKSELKKLVAANLKRKGWTDDMASILIDVLWRDKYTMRTAGFYYPGGTDATIKFDNVTRTFSIFPVDPLVSDFVPRFGFYSWSQRAIYHRRYELETIQLPNEEGLFAIYFAADAISRSQLLHFVKNPSEKETKDLYIKKVLVSFIYWDFDNQTALYFGNDRHGSEWNPQMHWTLHKTLRGQVDTGLTVTNLLINEDGSLDSHAQFTVNSGNFWHDDFLLDIPTAGGTGTIPVLYFSTANKPRFIQTTGFGIYKNTNRITHNSNSTTLIETDSGKFSMYHLFAVNEHFDNSKKVISVMGTSQYPSVALAYIAIRAELNSIYQFMPQQGRCYLGTVILESNDDFTNSVKARIVFFVGDKDEHPPVTIAEDSTKFLGIDENQELRFIPGTLPITQAAHGFIVGDAIRHNGTIYLKAQADNDVNAQTCGIVTNVIDVDTFQFQSDGFLIDPQFEDGKEYFLSPVTSGLLIILPDPEIWNLGEVRQSLGWGTPQGLKIEIDVGDLITTTEDEITIADIAEDVFEEIITGTTEQTDLTEIFNDSVVTLFKNTIDGFKQSYIIENTTELSIIQESTWLLTQFNEQVGNFKVTAVITNKVSETIVTLQNTMGFDYSDALQITDDNGIITDGTISLLLSVNISNLLIATISNMPADTKRIHFCFERCVLGARPLVVSPSFEIGMRMTASLVEILNINAGFDIGMQMATTLELPVELTSIYYGLLYNWKAISDVRNIANGDWMIPSEGQWDTLIAYCGGSTVAGLKLRETGTTFWLSETGVTNEFGFNARGAARRLDTGGFSILRFDAHFWTSKDWSSASPKGGSRWKMIYSSGVLELNFAPQVYGQSVRLLKSTTTLSHGESGIYLGNDGKAYRTICIGTQEWMADNLFETEYENGDPIPEVTDDATWGTLTTGARCYWNNDENNA